MPSSTRRFSTALFLVPALLLLASCEGHHKTETVQIEVGEIHKVVVESGAGDVQVYGDDCEFVEIYAALDEEDELDYEVRDGVLYVDPDCTGFLGCGADFIITVPFETSAEVSTGAGDVKVADLSGSVWIDTGAGDVDVDRLASPTLEVDTGSGDVEGTGLRVSEALFDTGAGDVEATWVQKPDEVIADTGAGDVDLWLPRGNYDISVDTGAGDYDRDNLGDDSSSKRRIRVDTGAGDVTLTGI